MAKRPSVTEQARRLTKGQINRRRFIMSAVASGVTLPTATALASRAEARVPRAGGTLRIATAARPGEAGGAFDRFLAMSTGNTLTRVTSDGRVVGELAASVSASADHRVWRITLRDGVALQSGETLDAACVAASLGVSFPDLLTATVEDAATLTLRLAEPMPVLGIVLARPEQVIRDPETGLTTGGYRIEHQGADAVRLTRVPDYWKQDAAHFEAVEIRAIPDAAARHRAVMTGEVDYADEIDTQVVATLRGLPMLDILETEGTHHLAFPMRHDVPPFDAAPLRSALAAAIKGEPLLASAVLGHGAVIGHDIAAADGLALGPFGVLELHVSDEAIPGSLAAARLVQRQADAADIAVAIRNHPTADWPEARARAGWYVSRGPGAPETDAIPRLSLNAISAHSAALSHPGTVCSMIENDAYRIADRWWFETFA